MRSGEPGACRLANRSNASPDGSRRPEAMALSRRLLRHHRVRLDRRRSPHRRRSRSLSWMTMSPGLTTVVSPTWRWRRCPHSSMGSRRELPSQSPMGPTTAPDPLMTAPSDRPATCTPPMGSAQIPTVRHRHWHHLRLRLRLRHRHRRWTVPPCRCTSSPSSACPTMCVRPINRLPGTPRLLRCRNWDTTRRRWKRPELLVLLPPELSTRSVKHTKPTDIRVRHRHLQRS